MNLIVDAGNTRTKIAVFKETELVHTESIKGLVEVDRLVELCAKYDCKKCIVSNVGAFEKSAIAVLEKEISVIFLDSKTSIPFKNAYKTPATLGVDRIALASAAVTLYPNKNVLVIDAGTCITYEYIDRQGNYLGGAISPGIQMRYKSLNQFTSKLPMLTPEIHEDFVGKSTVECMHIGVMQGIINEIDSFIESYREKNKNLTVVLTGGDAKSLSNSLKNGIFANPNFLLEGLNSILTCN